MAYLHCIIQHGVIHVVRNYPDVQSPAGKIDFVTGDFTLPAPASQPQNPWALLPGSTVGTDLTTAVSASGTTWVMTDTTGMNADDKVGIELDAGHWFYTNIVTVDSGTQLTVIDGIPSGAAIGNRVAVASQLDTATDFTLQHDFKSLKADRIISRTQRLLNRGVSHANRKFAANTKIQALLAGIDSSGIANATFMIPDRYNKGYDVVDASDFTTLQDAVMTRVRSMYDNTGGQMDLLNQVVDSDNTLIAMNAISDNRS